MLEEVVGELKKGVTVDGLRVRADDFIQSRSGNEVDCAVYVSFSGEKESLLIIRFFYGIKGHYFPWAELFAIKPSVYVGGRKVNYFGSSVEEKILKLTANHLRAGARFSWNTMQTMKRQSSSANASPCP